MLSHIGERFSAGLKALKKKILSLPALLRDINGRRNEFQRLLDRANSFTQLMSTSSSVIEYNVSGTDGAPIVGNRTGVRTTKTDSPTTLIEDFNVPDKAEVYSNSKLADDLEAAIAYINQTIAQLREFDDRTAKAQIKELMGWKSQYQEKLNDIVDIIGDMYDRHVPALYEDMVNHAIAQINSSLPEGSYKDMNLANQTITSHDTFANKSDAAVEFTTFIEIDGLDSTHFKSSELYIALTGVVYESSLSATTVSKEKTDGVIQRLSALKVKPELVELIQERSNALLKGHNRKVVQIVNQIKKYLQTNDPKYAKLATQLEDYENRGRDTSTVQVKIDAHLQSLYASIALLDNKGGRITSTDAQLKAIYSKLEAARKRKAKPEIIQALEKQIEERYSTLSASKIKPTPKRNMRVGYHMAFFVTVLSRVRGPGMFDPGVEIQGTSPQAIKRNLTKELRILLAMHSTTPIVGKLPIGKTTQEMRHSPLGNVPGVSDIRVVDDIIEIHTTTKEDSVIDNTIIPDALLALNSMFRTNKQNRFHISRERRGASKGIVLLATYVKA
jgi:hypothetical protein